MDEKKTNKETEATALPESSLSAVTGGLRSLDWRTCGSCGYNGGGFSYTDGNRSLKCPQCGAKQSAW